MSRDQTLIYTGKNKLRVLNLIDGRYNLLKVGENIENFVDIKLLKNGEIIVLQERNSDLVKYDRNLKVIKRLKGKNKISMSKYTVKIDRRSRNCDNYSYR